MANDPGLARSERGIALPMALMTLLLFTTLALSFVALAQTEPTIASNHLRASQAHALAESGLARALWALTHATATDGFGGDGEGANVTIAAAAAPPYDGTRFVPVSPIGGFHLTITGADPALRVARATGFTPTSDLDDPRTRARSEIIATLVRVRNLAREMPCALCTDAPMSLASTVIDARGSDATDCGAKVGALSAAALTLGAGAQVFGAGDPDGAPSNVEGRDWRQHQPPVTYLTAEDLLTLKSLAIGRGTYVRPASDARLAVSGVTAGLVFVDTPDGTNQLTATNVANVIVGPALAASAPFRGWLVVNGNVILDAGAEVAGLVYAANAIVTEGPATIHGLVVARQALGGAGPGLTNLTARFDCAAARGGGQLPSGWFIRAGTWCDGSAGC